MYGSTYGKRQQRRGGGGWLFLLLLAVLMILRFGGSQRLVDFRESAQSFFQERIGGIDYEEALETLGRSFSDLRNEDSAVSVFGREVLGLSPRSEGP